MKATIWHNPACGTSRKTLDILRDSGANVTVVEYLKHPLTRDELSALLKEAGLTPQQALRMRGTDAAERGLPDANADTILNAMTANPAYVERPLVRSDKGARLCRPQDVVRDIL